jgi:Cupredoxin-like domain
MRKPFVVFCLLSLVMLVAASARADDYTITIKDHKFTPEEIKLSANQRAAVTVINNDDTAEEFDSTALKVEKVVAGKS